MSQPIANVASTASIGQRQITVESSGSELQIEARVAVGWHPGDGINIGHGESSDIRVEVKRGFTQREVFSIPVDPGGPVFSGNFPIDREAMNRGVVGALGKMGTGRP